jgi:sugar phosphate isomerase/epimerase
MPTIGLSSFALGVHAKPLEVLEFALQQGFQGMELGSYTLWPPEIDAPGRKHIRSLAAAHEIDLSIHFIHRAVAPASHNPERRALHRNELEQTIEIANDIGAGVVVVHPGPIDCPGVAPNKAPESVRQEALENLRGFLEETAPKAEEAGVIICVENMHHNPGQVIQKYTDLLNLVEAVSSPAVQITLDVGHADRADGITDALETFAPYLRHIHMHDSNGVRDHLEIGQGRLDFSQWIDKWRDYPFMMVLESRNESDLHNSVVRSRDRLRDVLGPAER